MIADEVITGFGRLGEWFGSTFYEIKPDMIPFAKGVTSGYLPLGGVLVSDRVAGTIIDQGGEFAHGFTYSGHPAACAVALKNIELIKKENILDSVKELNSTLFKGQMVIFRGSSDSWRVKDKGINGSN